MASGFGWAQAPTCYDLHVYCMSKSQPQHNAGQSREACTVIANFGHTVVHVDHNMWELGLIYILLIFEAACYWQETLTSYVANCILYNSINEQHVHIFAFVKQVSWIPTGVSVLLWKRNYRPFRSLLPSAPLLTTRKPLTALESVWSLARCSPFVGSHLFC